MIRQLLQALCAPLRRWCTDRGFVSRVPTIADLLSPMDFFYFDSTRYRPEVLQLIEQLEQQYHLISYMNNHRSDVTPSAVLQFLEDEVTRLHKPQFRDYYQQQAFITQSQCRSYVMKLRLAGVESDEPDVSSTPATAGDNQ